MNESLTSSTLQTSKSKQNSHRVIAHFDVDAFYVACERELRPDLLRNKPVAVSQYNPYGDLRTRSMDDDSRVIDRTTMKDHPDSNGSLIAVSYEARAQNVRRNDRGKDAMAKCPELIIVQVPVKNGKADLTIYRSASERLMKELVKAIHESTLQIFHDINESKSSQENFMSEYLQKIKVEKASVDEVYIDLSIPVKYLVQHLFGEENKSNTETNKTYNSSAEPKVKKKKKPQTFAQLIHTGGADTHTTIGGLETSKEAIAANSLSKDDIRKGSSLQVLDSTHVVDSGSHNWWHRPLCDWEEEEIHLAIGATITYLARMKLLSKFQSIFTLSAGVSLNKLMAKLASGLKKPNRQTLINPTDGGTLQKLFYPLPIGRIRGLGGKFGDSVSSTLNISTVGELAKVPLPQLLSKYPTDQANFMFDIARGLCKEEVIDRTKSKSIGASKTFRGALSFSGKNTPVLQKWTRNLMREVMDRLQSDHDRYAKTIVVSIVFLGKKAMSQSASLPRHGTLDTNTEIAMKISQKLVSMKQNDCTIISLSISATNLTNVVVGSNSIQSAFSRVNSHQTTPKSNIVTKMSTPIQSIPSKNAGIENSKKKSSPKPIRRKLSLDPNTSSSNIVFNFGSDHELGNYDVAPDHETNKNLKNNECDPDLEYAKALQASFDNENEVLSTLERKHSRRLSSNLLSKKNASRSLPMHKREKYQSINMFFKKRKR